MLLADLLTDPCLASLLIQLKATCLGNGATYSGSALLHQLSIKVILTDMPTGLSDLDNPSTKTGSLEKGLPDFSGNAGNSVRITGAWPNPLWLTNYRATWDGDKNGSSTCSLLLAGRSIQDKHLPLGTQISMPKSNTSHLANSRLASYTHCDVLFLVSPSFDDWVQPVGFRAGPRLIPLGVQAMTIPKPLLCFSKSQSLTNSLNTSDASHRGTPSEDEAKAETIRNLRKSFASLFSD